MILSEHPKSQESDICLVLEGTYPFVKGGVSRWVHDLITSFPQYRFALIFLGTKPDDYTGLLYTLPANVVHLDVHYLFDDTRVLEEPSRNIDNETMSKLKRMHDAFPTCLSRHTNSIPELFDLMNHPEQLTETMFLRSESSWEMMIQNYLEKYTDQSFFDYFWSIRNLHTPFWKLARISKNVPQTRLIHSASTGYAGFIAALIQNRLQIPYVLTEHGIYAKERWIELMRNYFFNYIIKEQNQFNSKKSILHIWQHFFIILSKIAYDAADPIISLIERYRRHQIADGALPEKTRIISYGINFEHYQFANRTLDQKNPVIACIGRVVPIKDIKTFIRAAALILNRKPNADVWIIGSFQEDPDYAESCKNLVSTFGLENKVKFLGEQNVIKLYPKIDLLMLTSISEGTPYVMLECFAVGIPVVATDVGGCAELIEGKNEADRALGKSGKLVHIADPEGLAKAALELLDNEAEWKSAQQAGYERVRRYYNMEEFVSQYRAIYEKEIR